MAQGVGFETVSQFGGISTEVHTPEMPSNLARDARDVGRGENFAATEASGALCKRPGYYPLTDWARAAKINGILYFDAEFCTPIILVMSHSTATAANCTVARWSPDVVWTVPTVTLNPALHFQIQLGTDSTFATNIADHFSNTSQTGFDYISSGTTWSAVGAGGVTSTYYGNAARYVFQNSDYRLGLRMGEQYYWRWRYYNVSTTTYGSWSSTLTAVF